MFGVLERGQCADIPSEAAPWPALSALCRAAIDGDTSQWAVAEAAAADGKGGAGCYVDAAWALLTRALAWHARNPDRTPEISYPTPGSPTACDFAITDVHLLDAGGRPLGGPLEGPMTGGTLLVIDGEGIDDPESVVVGWGPATIVADVFAGGADGVVVRTVAAPQTGTVEIALRNRAGEVRASQRFTYVSTGTDTQPGTGTQPRTGPQPGTGTGPETGTQPGTGTDPGTGTEPETGTDPGLPVEP